MSWIDLSAIWKIVVFGLIAGAGLPALFALGLVSLSRPGHARAGRVSAVGAGGNDDVLIGGDLLGTVVAVIAFLIVLAAIGWGIYEIYTLGHPATHK
jgi:hypothetical protein